MIIQLDAILHSKKDVLLLCLLTEETVDCEERTPRGCRGTLQRSCQKDAKR